jgi:hypothetical protein
MQRRAGPRSRKFAASCRPGRPDTRCRSSASRNGWSGDGVTTAWWLALAVLIAWFLAGVGIGRGWRLEAEARLRRRVRDLEEELTRNRPEPHDSVEPREAGEAPR